MILKQLKIKKELGAKERKQRVKERESSRQRIQGTRSQMPTFDTKNQNHQNDNFMCYSTLANCERKN
jgi:hypothetical protein